MNVKSLLISILVLLSVTGFSQNGTLTGRIYDKGLDEELIGASVFVTDDAGKGTITDVFGNYTFALPAGIYSISATYMGYVKMTLTEVEIKAGETTTLNFPLVEDTEQLGEVVFEARAVQNSEGAILAERKKALIVSDGISGQEISRSGARDAGAAVKQITGASLEGGKYPVIRGLGDRYSITQLNGVTLPSTDPYRNASSLDLIPSFMLDNIVTSKTFSPDQPGNFTGGNMNIRTKSYPEKFFLSFGVRASYNSISSLRTIITADGGLDALPEDMLLHENRNRLSKGNWLEAKADAKENGNYEEVLYIDKFARELNSPLLPVESQSLLDHSVGFSAGNMHVIKGKNPLGWVIGAKYKKDYSYYDNGIYNRWQATKEGMQERFEFSDEKGSVSENTGAYASLSYRIRKRHEFTLSSLLNHDENVFARVQEGISEQVGPSHLYQPRGMGNKIRDMRNIQLRASHDFPSLNKTKIEWMGGITQSSQFEPDLRFFSNHIMYWNDGDKDRVTAMMDKSSYGLPSHFFRELVDIKYDGKVDVTIPITAKEGNQIKMGALYSMKKRDFSEYRFKAAVLPSVKKFPVSKSVNNPNFDSVHVEWLNDEEFVRTRYNGNEVYDQETLTWPNWESYTSNFGIDTTTLDATNYYINDTRLTNMYTGTETIWGAYAMAVFNLRYNLKTVAGLRVEGTDMSVVSADTNLTPGSINSVDFLPSLNLIYSINDKQNLRFSATQTLARPNLREMAPFFSFDFLGGFLYSGNDSLKRTLIRNFDARWELYNKPGEMMSFSVYYKQFLNPIVRVFKVTSSTGEITYKNLDQAIVYGAEYEFRKNLDFISTSLSNFKIAANVSYTYSKVDVPKVEQEAAENNGMLVQETRPFQGQSPFLLNTNLFYKNDSIKLQSSLTFNMFGKRLYEVGVTGNPDIYELPRPLLNYNLKKDIKNFQISFSVGNILNAKFRTVQTYKGQDENGNAIEKDYINEFYPMGRTFSLGISYKI